MLFEILIAKIQENSKKNLQISIHGFQVGSQKQEKYVKIFLMPYLALSQI
jgi:hypothetical protein